VNEAMAAEICIEIVKAGPARPAAIPVTTKIPPPIIAPKPIIVASNNPIPRFNVVFVLSAFSIKISPRGLGNILSEGLLRFYELH